MRAKFNPSTSQGQPKHLIFLKFEPKFDHFLTFQAGQRSNLAQNDQISKAETYFLDLF